jgi:hypothetical protein
MRNLPTIPKISTMYLPGRRVTGPAGTGTVIHATVHPRPEYTVVYDHGGEGASGDHTAVRPDLRLITADEFMRDFLTTGLTIGAGNHGSDLLYQLDLAVHRARHTLCKLTWFDPSRAGTVGCGFYVEPGYDVCGAHLEQADWFSPDTYRPVLAARVNPIRTRYLHERYALERYIGLVQECVAEAHRRYPDVGIPPNGLNSMMIAALYDLYDEPLRPGLLDPAVAEAASRGLIKMARPGETRHPLFVPHATA